MSFQVTEQDIHNLVMKTGGDASQSDAVIRYLKDTIPNGGERNLTGYVYENGPFSLIEGDIYSSIVDGGSMLTQWLPTQAVTHRFENVKHLEWVAAEGFDGSQPYSEFLSGQTIDDCGYGPSTSWSGFEYKLEGGSFSWKTGNMKPIPDGGVSYWKNQPIHTVRGEPGMLSSDRDWAIAQVMITSSNHLDWVNVYGDRANSQMEWDGIDRIITSNYVTSRVIGSGIPHWARPIIENGASITTAAGLVQAIRGVVRRIRNRLKMRNMQYAVGDMVLHLPSTMWDAISESIAAGDAYNFNPTGNQFTGQMTYADFQSRYKDIRNANVFDVDGQPLAVLADPRIGLNVTINPGGTATPGISGPVHILTKRAGGQTFLEQQYIDYSKLTYPSQMESYFNLQNGLARAGWVTEANKCYYYYMEMNGRIVIRGIQYQASITNVTIPTLVANEYESGSFTSPDFYAFAGNQGGGGTGYLSPQ